MIGALGDELRKLATGDWLVREEKSLTLGRFSRPIPDIAMVRAPRARYEGRAPTGKETTLIVEVSRATYRVDRGLKWRLSASAAVPCYWIANLATRQIEAYGNPAGRGRSASYREATTFGPGAEIPVVIDGQEVGRVAVREIFL